MLLITRSGYEGAACQALKAVTAVGAANTPGNQLCWSFTAKFNKFEKMTTIVVCALFNAHDAVPRAIHVVGKCCCVTVLFDYLRI